MTEKVVVWVDDEPNLVSGEVFDLQTRGYRTIAKYDASQALDWINSHTQEVCQASAIVIDLLMPSRGDERFKSANGEPVGLLLCKILQKSFAEWRFIQPWLTLYSRSPNTPSLEMARAFAIENKLHLVRKNSVSRIALELMREHRIKE
jgi:hypothetical protein